jgi:membrane fusion protein, multidrug efflux system
MDKDRFEQESKLLLKSEEDSRRPSKGRKGRWVLILIILGGITYGGYRWWPMVRPAAADATVTPGGDNAGGRGGRGRGRGNGGGRAAVVTVPARKVDMPVYLRGLGTVAAYNTVTVRSRVDGQLVRVAFKEGQFVTQGDLLAEIDKRPFEVQLAQAKGQLARDEALLKSAMLEQQRNKLLLDKGLIPQQQFDLQIATVGQYEGAIQADQAQIESANLQITYSKVTSPISGQIGLRLVDEGNIVRAADPNGMVVITQLQPISVMFPIPEDNLSDVLKKLRAGRQMRVEAWDHDDVKKIADGVLVTVDNQIDPTTGTSKLKAVFDNKNNALYPNQFVNVRLLIDTLTNAITVSAAAVQRGAPGTFVYVIDNNQTARLRPVTIRNTEGNDVAVTGLEAGEAVVLDGMDKIQDGARVDVQTPGQTPDGSGGGGRRGGGRGGRGGRGEGGGRGQGGAKGGNGSAQQQ